MRTLSCYLRNANAANALCLDCHTQATHRWADCAICHGTHATGNLYNIRREIGAPGGRTGINSVNGMPVLPEPNVYLYANSNPLKYADPSGQFGIVLPLIPPALEALGYAVGYTLLTIGTAIGFDWLLDKAEETCDDGWREHCIDMYELCIMDKWSGSCGDCLNKCTAQHEWPFHDCCPRGGY